MSRPAYHVDVASTAAVNISQPAGSVQTSGFPANSKFSSANANWLFRRLGEWGRELDQNALRVEHWLDAATPQLADGNGVSVPTGSGLGPLSPDDGGVYYLDGKLVDLSAAAIATKYSGAWTFGPATTTYLHARVDPANSGSSYGEILASTNPTEVGYEAIVAVVTDATDVTTVTNLAETRRHVAPRVTFLDDVRSEGTLEVAVGGVLSVFGTSTFSDTVGVSASEAGDLVTITQTGAGRALEVSAAGAGAAIRASALGTGTALDVVGGTGAAAATITAGAGEYGLTLFGAANTLAASIVASGTGSALELAGGGSGTAALNVYGNGGNTGAIEAASSGTGTAIIATSGSGAGSLGIYATSGSTTSKAVSARGSTTGGATGSWALYGDGQQGVGVEALSSAYYGLIVRGDPTSPTYTASKWIGQDDDPAVAFDGDLFFHSGFHQFRAGVAGYGYRSFLAMGPGSSLYVMAHNTGGTTSENAGVWTNAVTAYGLEANGSGYHGSGAILVRATFEARTLVAGANIVNARIIVNGVTAETRSGSGTGATAGFNLFTTGTTDWQRTICWAISTTPGTTGDLTVDLEIQRGTANGIQIRDAMLEVVGTF